MPNKTKNYFEPHADSTCLVVLVHGWDNNRDTLVDIKKEIVSRFPDADLLRSTYKNVIPYNEDPFELAGEIEALIDDTYQNHRTSSGKDYEKIILIGYSFGALLLRKAYVYGMGSTEDFRIYGGKKTPAHDWVSKVERIILIAGVNRGWSLEEKPDNMSATRWFSFRLLALIFRPLPVANYIKSLERGAPFVANLRLQWIRLVQENSAGVAPVFQLLGSIDDLTTARDDSDLYVHNDFIFIPVVGANHATLVRFNGTFMGQHCREKFVEALAGNIADLKEKYMLIYEDGQRKARPLERPGKHIIFVLHGIRDYGQWTQSMRETLGKFAADNRLPAPEVVTPSYDYFPMSKFLLMPNRQKHVRWFMDQYTERLAASPNPKSVVSFIGHSNGTYILASALKKYATMRIHRASFAGSVVPREYDWEQVITQEGRVEKLRNDRAAEDWVVGIFPKLFDQRHWFDIGSGGFDGFTANVVNQYEGDRYYKGGHGAAIAPANRESIAKFILTGEIVRDSNLLTDSQPGWLQTLSKLCLAVWVLILAILILGLWVTYLIGGSLSTYFQINKALTVIVLEACYLGLVGWLLNVI